jgi:two-component system nitrate/nitrite response regulator NarL
MSAGWELMAHSHRFSADFYKHLPVKPDVYLVCFDTVDTHGLGLMRKVLRQDRRAVMLALIPPDKAMVLASLQEGAKGICFRGEIPAHLLKGLDAVLNGHYHLSPEATRLAMTQCMQTNLPSNGAVHQMVRASLTPKEVEVLTVMRGGKPAKVVAHVMGISVYTVNQHLRSIYRKLNVHNRIEAVHLAHESGLI